MKHTLIEWHVSFYVAKLSGLELFFSLVPCCIKYETMRVKVRVGNGCAHWPCCLMYKIRPHQLSGYTIIVLSIFSNARFAIGLNVKHGFINAPIKGFKNMVVIA